MTQKAKILLGVNIVLLFAIILSVWSGDESTSTLGEDADAFVLQDTSGVQRIDLAGKSFIKQQDSWVVDKKYTVAPRRMAFLISALNRLEVKRPVSGAEAQQISQQIASEGKEIKVYDSQNNLLKSYKVIGKAQETFAMVAEQPYSVYIPGINLNIYDFLVAPVQEWRDRRVLLTTWRTLKSLSVTFHEEPDKSFQIGFNDNFYEVKGVDQLDSAALYNYIIQYEGFRAQKFIANDKLKSDLRTASPFCTIELQDLYSERDNVMEIYPSQEQIYGYLPKSEDCLLLDAESLKRILVPKEAFVRKEG